MCRWLAYMGSPIPISRILYETEHSLIDQSLAAREALDTTNGDGYGVGWYTPLAEDPGIYRSVSPAWSDTNLFELATHIESSLFFAHVRAATDSMVQITNCHPFRHEHFQFMHNGAINGHRIMRRDLAMAIQPDLFDDISGTTDSELLFYLAVTFGLEKDPIGALELAAGFVEALAVRHGIEHPVQLSAAVSDGTRIWAVRYSSEGATRTMYASSDTRTLKAMYPEDQRLHALPDDARMLVSEPLGHLPGAWEAVPESTAVTMGPDGTVQRPFEPRVPSAAALH